VGLLILFQTRKNLEHIEKEKHQQREKQKDGRGIKM
jgi:hypothetical protein